MSENKIAPALGQAYELGQWMGRKQAFSGLAGRCSAADAECLCRIRSLALAAWQQHNRPGERGARMRAALSKQLPLSIITSECGRPHLIQYE